MAPGLHGRVDVARYAVSLATCRNFITRPAGGAVKRPGYRFNGAAKDAANPPRILPFVYSTEIKYLVEAGVGYLRFWIPATPRGYALLRDGASAIVEVATPYTAADLPELRITQSADVLYIAGVNGTVKVPPKELRRLTATSFELRDHDFRRGPFRSMNGEEAVQVAVSAATGNVTVTANRALFTAGMVGGYLYLEEKELRAVKPWTPLERSVVYGALRRSDGKVYRCSSIPSLAGVTPGTPYYICGNDRPVHEIGRAFDGPQDKREDGVNGYKVGVEWEYLHGSFGIVKLTGYSSTTSMTGVVVERVADAIVGTVPAPVAGPWNHVGNGTAKTFALTAGGSNTSPSVYDYTVTIAAAPISPNPYQPPISGGGGVGGGDNAGNPGGDPSNYQVP